MSLHGENPRIVQAAGLYTASKFRERCGFLCSSFRENEPKGKFPRSSRSFVLISLLCSRAGVFWYDHPRSVSCSPATSLYKGGDLWLSESWWDCDKHDGVSRELC